ncbi:MAG: hypothetical protein H8F28_13045 [Fibrella sp.]|nr:hypothetical protein [Armatimonadota bacterium]
MFRFFTRTGLGYVGAALVALHFGAGCSAKPAVVSPQEKAKFMGRPPTESERAMIAQKAAEMKGKGNPGPNAPAPPSAKKTAP